MSSTTTTIQEPTTTLMDASLLSSQPSSCWLIQDLPFELHVNILTYLRAYDLSSVQLVCRFLANPNLTHAIVHHTAHYVYPPELTKGCVKENDSTNQQQQEEKLTYQSLRNLELLVVARVLNRPEPKHGGYYVSKSWCKTALRWLEVQQQEQQNVVPKKKLSKKQQRIRKRRLSDASPPWPNVNSDIVCEHHNLRKANSKAVRARRKVLDRQAWKVLKKLYPDSTQLELSRGECLLCCVEQETARKNELDRLEKLKAKRKQPLSCPLTRGIYTRSRGVPLASLVESSSTTPTATTCPLKPGLYHVLPRAWCHAWRRYIRQGGDEEPCAPNATALLCDAHRLPLIPPHLEAYLGGETSVLLSSSSSNNNKTEANHQEQPLASPVGMNPLVARAPVQQQQDVDDDMMNSLAAIGMSPSEVASQRMAMLSLEEQSNVQQQQPINNNATPQRQEQQLSHGELLDRENKVVVEILTQEEHTALEQWWPKSHSNFSLRFAVSDNAIGWSATPCRECDASRHYGRNDLVVRNRARGWVKKSSVKKKSPASLEY